MDDDVRPESRRFVLSCVDLHRWQWVVSGHEGIPLVLGTPVDSLKEAEAIYTLWTQTSMGHHYSNSEATQYDTKYNKINTWEWQLLDKDTAQRVAESVIWFSSAEEALSNFFQRLGQIISNLDGIQHA